MTARTHALRSALKELGIFLLFALLYAVMFPGCYRGITEGYLGGSRGDAGIYLYLESINANRFFNLSSEGFDLPTFYPYRHALAYSDNFLLPSLLAKLLLPVLGSEPLTYNVIILTALALNGYCAFLLCRKATGNFVASLYGGFVFMCFPYFVFHRGHPQLQFAFWIPLTLLAVLHFAESRSYRSATSIGASVAGAFFCSVYYAMYGYLLAAVTLLGVLALRPRGFSLRDLWVLFAANVPWLALLAPASIPYVETRDSLGGNPLAVLRAHSPSLTAFVAPPMVEKLWSQFMRHISRMEGFLFFGFVPTALSLAAIAKTWQKASTNNQQRLLGRVARWSIYLAIVGGCVSVIRAWYFTSHPGNRTAHHLAWVTAEALWPFLAASFITLLANRADKTDRSLNRLEIASLFSFLAIFFVFATLGIKDTGPARFHAPELYRFIMHLPGYEALRGLARMGLLAVLCLVVLAATGFAMLLDRLYARSRSGAFGFALIMLVLAALELRTRPDVLVPLQPAPKIYETARNLPTHEPILALPIRSATVGGRDFMFWNSLHALWLRQAENPVVNGFSGKSPLFHSLVSYQLDEFPSRHSLSVLAELVGVRYVLTNSRFYGPKTARAIRKRASQLSGEVSLVQCDKHSNCIFRVSPIMDTRELKNPELLIRSEEFPQVVSFEARPASSASSKEWALSLQVDEGGVTPIERENQPLPNDSQWHKVSLPLPPSSKHVNPFLVRIGVSGADGALIRNISASRAN